MAWIQTIPDDEWEGELGDLYDTVVDKAYGRVDEIMAIHSLDPKTLKAHLGLYNSAMAGTKTLRKVERELIALAVSQTNGCHY